MNLLGKCNFGNSCKYEHTNSLYIWKILDCINEKTVKGFRRSYLISNRTFSNQECETLERGFCDADFLYDDKNLFEIR